MEPFWVGVMSVGILLFLLVVGVHIGAALALSGFIGILVIHGLDSAAWNMTTAMYHKVSTFSLMAVPLFILMGLLATGGGISGKLYDALSLWMGRFRAGLGIATVFACTAFGTICGSSGVTAAVFARISAPEMRRHGYDKNLAYALCSASGCIGMLIPPSILMIVYGVLSGDSIGALFVAGFAPGLALTFTFSLGLVALARWKPQLIAAAPPRTVTCGQRISSTFSFWPLIVVAGVIFGGIFAGVFTPTEAGAVATFVMLVLVLAIRGLSAKKMIGESFVDTAVMSAMLFLIFAGATVFSNLLVMSGVSQRVIEVVTGWGMSNMLLVIMLTVIYLVMGCFLDGISMVSITVPLLTPVILERGIDPIWYAMVVILAMHVGMITPPVGLTVYCAKGVAEKDVTIEGIFSGVVPFFLLMLVSLAIIVGLPWLSTYLPSRMLGTG